MEKSPIEAIIENGYVEEIANNIKVRSDYMDDFVQEIYLILLEYDQEKLGKMVESGQIKFFLTRIMLNQWQSKTSTFYYKYRKMYEHIDENVDWQRDEEQYSDEYSEDN